MHEFSVMAQIVDGVVQEASKRKAKRVEQVNLEVGDFTMLGDEQLMFAYELLSKDTILQGSTLDIKHIKGRVRCRHCGYEGPMKPEEDSPHRMVPILECPKCCAAAEITEGRECVVRNIRMVVPDV